MENKRGEHFKFAWLLLLSAFALTVAAISTGAYSRAGYKLSVGMVSPTKFVAPRDVVDTITTERLREDARKSVMDLYEVDNAVNERLFRQMDAFFEQVYELRKEKTPIYIPNDENPSEPAEAKLQTYISQSQIKELTDMDALTYNSLQSDAAFVLQRVLESGVRPDGEEKALSDARDQIFRLDYTQSTRLLAYDVAANFIEPNTIIDREATNARRDEKAAQVKPVMYLKNQKIVDQNEVITESAFAMLESLGFVSKSYFENLLPTLGAVIIVLVIFAVAAVYIRYYHKDALKRRKTLALLFILYASAIAGAWLMVGRLPYIWVPELIFTMLVSMLVSCRMSLVLNFCVTVVTLLIFKGDIDYFMYFIVTGSAAGILARHATERGKVLLIALLTGTVGVCAFLGCTMFFEINYVSKLLLNMLAAFVSGVLTVVICTGSLPFWEAVFGIVTPLKLLELTNPNNELLRRLVIEAPGTYHHSLIVANLAETAAFDIDANPAVARVGGYYHDVGKLKYPQYFAENQIGSDNPHDFIDARQSASIIRSHVDFGLEMAANYKIPLIIKDMIGSHHGSTVMKYFFHKYRNDNPDAEEDDFRYLHNPPATREGAVLMLADTVEAAVRSIKSQDKSMSEIEAFVRALIKEKLDDGQLTESGLTIKDLETVTKSFMRVLQGMYHERVQYPNV
ncbi:MAG: HDIG domain-containing protein [Clostridiales bacterium]|jgi:putative nucleotidyltransferase with HDIG domain|nr:HDIG domain-containing protein [Clostridiales bacterium]